MNSTRFVQRSTFGVEFVVFPSGCFLTMMIKLINNDDGDDNNDNSIDNDNNYTDNLNRCYHNIYQYHSNI